VFSLLDSSVTHMAGYNVYWTINAPVALGIRLDKWCADNGVKRSKLIKELLEKFLDKEEFALGDRQYHEMLAKRAAEKPADVGGLTELIDELQKPEPTEQPLFADDDFKPDDEP
jgi:hypothetical protein